MLTPEQQKIVLGKMQELTEQKAKMANDVNSDYSRIVKNQSIAVNNKYNKKLTEVDDIYKTQLQKAAVESFIPFMGGSSLTPDRKQNLIHLFETVNSTGLGPNNIPEGDLDEIIQVGSVLTGLHLDLNGRTASDVYNIYRAAIEYGYTDKLKMQQAMNCMANYKNFDSKELKEDREAALEYYGDNRDRLAAASGAIHSAENIGKQTLVGVNDAHKAKVDAIQMGLQQELSKISNIAFAGASTGHSASDILRNIQKVIQRDLLVLMKM